MVETIYALNESSRRNFVGRVAKFRKEGKLTFREMAETLNVPVGMVYEAIFVIDEAEENKRKAID